MALRTPMTRTTLLIGMSLGILALYLLVTVWSKSIRLRGVNGDWRPDQMDTRLLVSSEAKTRVIIKENLDDSGAVAYLTKYKNAFVGPGENVPLGDPSDPSSIQTWWQGAAMVEWYLRSRVRYPCKNKVFFGNWHACQDPGIMVKPPCLVYSFGIDNDFSFDDAMGKLGCEVHSFDPSMKTKGHKRSENVTFHDLGIGGFNTDAFVARNDIYVKDRQVWKMRTVQRIKKMLGHENKVIDVFKLDVESYEWHIVDNMIDSGMFDEIRQFLVEFHLFWDYPLREDFPYAYRVYKRMREMGIREYHVDAHTNVMDSSKFKLQGDQGFINAKFLKNP